jgi:hypothetical protein
MLCSQLLGLQGTSALGSETAFTSVDIAVTGVSATGIANYSVWDATVYLGGWGRAGWGDFGFGTDSISVQGTGEVGSVTVSEGVGVFPVGVEAHYSSWQYCSNRGRRSSRRSWQCSYRTVR